MDSGREQAPEQRPHAHNALVFRPPEGESRASHHEAGSGTTLIAAGQLGRKCYGMEISPQYCDVIVTRWEKLTGKKAACNGKTIEQLAEERGVVV